MNKQDKFSVGDTLAVIAVLMACILFTFDALPALSTLIYSMVV